MDSLALVEAALAAKGRAYCPYSGYSVGAAIEADDGSVFVGCNVENVSYGATLCAERVALGSMIASGRRRVRRVVVATRDGGTPCGICLQVLAEFGEGAVVDVVDESGTGKRYTLDQLIPAAFASPSVTRTERNAE